MIRYLLLFTCCLPVCLPAQESVFGVWQAVDDADGAATSHIELFEKNGKMHGKIVKLLEKSDAVICEKCLGDLKNKPVLGMEILWDMEEKGSVWKGGRILDPEVGKDYKCRIKLNGDILEVRGYIGLPALGRTQNWYRVE